MTKLLNPIITKAFNDQSAVMKTADGEWSATQKKYSVNYSDIATLLIQNVGRFCERYASDFLISWSNIDRLMRTYSDEKTTDIEIFAIRASGVDHDNYLISNIKNNSVSYVSNYYRKIFALEVTRDSQRLTMTLKDITDSISMVDYTNTPYDAQQAVEHGFGIHYKKDDCNINLYITFNNHTLWKNRAANIQFGDGSEVQITYITDEDRNPEDCYFQIMILRHGQEPEHYHQTAFNNVTELKKILTELCAELSKTTDSIPKIL